ncbi:MAG: hypothetical protein JST26_07295 [Bacteroidetes bacterium]|nr:hypothetical protein [Bacteroidota bacterium]
MKKMTTIILISLFVLTGGGLFIYSCIGKEKNTGETERPYMKRTDAENAVNKLTELGYYKYADPTDVDSLREELTNSIAQYGILSTLYFDKPMIPKDYRYYIFDGEELFEQGGFDNALAMMTDFFHKTGFKAEVTNHTEETDSVSGGLNHALTVNGKRYVIFRNFKDYGWGEAAQRYADMINDQMQIQGIDERLYLINGGNDGAAVFLSEEQFKLIDNLLRDDTCKPLLTAKWGQIFRVQPPIVNDHTER